MRLWCQQLIPLLDRQRLLGQHRELCALRGNGFGRKHRTVDYVFSYGLECGLAKLYTYHVYIMKEMTRRGYKCDSKWYVPEYRGKICEPLKNALVYYPSQGDNVYKEHNNEYLQECIENLRNKGITITI